MLRGKFGKARISDLVASYAALALGRVGTAEYARPLLTALKSRGVLADADGVHEHPGDRVLPVFPERSDQVTHGSSRDA